jgi:hypothetical protein
MSRFFEEVRKIIFWWARVFALGVEWFEAIMAGLQLKGNGKTDTRTKSWGGPARARMSHLAENFQEVFDLTSKKSRHYLNAIIGPREKPRKHWALNGLRTNPAFISYI